MYPAGSSPKERFSDRVDDYVRYRPRYSHEIITALQHACGLTPRHVIVDVGCGTGLLAKIFLENGNRVIGVEPNAKMRQVGEQYLSHREEFTMLAGSAEDTALPAKSAHFVVAGQAFHWFQVETSRREFARILKQGGWVVLIWHDRDMESIPFLRAYEEFLQKYSIDYSRAAHNKVANYSALEHFFHPQPMCMIMQATRQTFDFEGLRGRLLSSSYAPRQGPGAERMLAELPQLFERFAENGQVTMEYKTKIYYGHLEA